MPAFGQVMARSSLARGLMYVHLPLRDSLSSSQSESVVRLRTVSGSMEGPVPISRDAAEGRGQAALQQVHLGRHFVHQIGEFALMLGDERKIRCGAW